MVVVLLEMTVVRVPARRSGRRRIPAAASQARRECGCGGWLMPSSPSPNAPVSAVKAYVAPHRKPALGSAPCGEEKPGHVQRGALRVVPVHARVARIQQGLPPQGAASRVHDRRVGARASRAPGRPHRWPTLRRCRRETGPGGRRAIGAPWPGSIDASLRKSGRPIGGTH